MKAYLTLISLVVFIYSQAQENRLSVFDNLMGKIWKAEGNWGDGSQFKQETIFQYSLDSTLVIAESKGFTNREQTEYGHRNHGIRKFDAQSNGIKFWEFDIFGGTTEGVVKIRDKDIVYTYSYGASTVTDYWEYVDENTYNFTVGSFKEGVWEQTYLKTQFVSQQNSFNFQFGQYTLVVSNLEETGNFYRDILKLDEISKDEKPNGLRWSGVNENLQLQLIEKQATDFEKDKSDYLSLTTQNLEDFIAHLKDNNIDFYDGPNSKKISPGPSDEVQQIYIQDPEGNWIKINIAKR